MPGEIILTMQMFTMPRVYRQILSAPTTGEAFLKDNKDFMQIFCKALAILCVVGFSSVAQPVAKELRCEHLVNPIGIDMSNLVLGWMIASPARNFQQAAYELIVDDDYNSIQRGNGKVWSSGRISSSENTNVAYGGSALKPFTKYFWRVRITGASGEISHC